MGVRSVIDLGCGPGQFLDRLVKTPAFTRVAGTDVSTRSLQYAARRLRLERMSERQAERVQLFQSALTYEDERLAGFDAAVLMEVVEHVDPPRLEALERVVFGAARPGAVIVTTPNSEYNVLYEGLVGMRHPDHRFEWESNTRALRRKVAAVLSKARVLYPNFLYEGREDPILDAFDLPGAIPVSILYDERGEEIRRWEGRLSLDEVDKALPQTLSP